MSVLSDNKGPIDEDRASYEQLSFISEQFLVKKDSLLPILCKDAMHGHVLFVPTSNACHYFFIISKSSEKK